MSRTTLKHLYSRVPHPLQQKIIAELRASPVGAKLLGWCHSRDFFVTSFPRCDRTWLRLMLGKVLVDHFGIPEDELIELAELADRYPKLPRIRLMHDDQPHLKLARHIASSKSFFVGKKVILLVRDPRDVFVSIYFYKARRSRCLNESISAFLRNERPGSLDSILTWMNRWAENLTVPKDLLLVRYEQMRENTAREVRRVIDFMSLDRIDDATIEQAVEFARFDRMRRMEAHNAMSSHRLRARSASDSESYTIRKGKVGGYRDYLSTDDITFIEARIASRLSDYYACYKYTS